MSHVFDELAGAWSGEGDGEYPTIDPFRYREELTITPVPDRPVALWVSRTRDATTGEARHGEAGFLRAVDDGIELVVAHSFGVTEVTTGSFTEGALTLDSQAVTLAPSAKQIAAVQRRYRFGGAACTYRIAMAAVGVDLTHHLAAELQRT